MRILRRGIIVVVFGILGSLLAAVGPAAAQPCTKCPPPPGGGGSDGPQYAVYLISSRSLNGGPLADGDKINTSSVAVIAKGQVQFQLHAEPTVRWWKEIKVFDRSGNALAQDYTQDDKRDTVTLSFVTADLTGASLVFSKAKAFGVHTGMYEVHNLTAFDGERLNLDWLYDG